MMNSHSNYTEIKSLTHTDPLHAIAKNIDACMQCGTCTTSCAQSMFMDHTPREFWRMVQLGLKDEIFNSRTFWLCSSCYYCTLRCPRGLSLTETMSALKRLATAEGRSREKKSIQFYETFLDNVRRYGRVREVDMMTRYFLALKSALAPISFMPLGIKMMLKGKISIRMPNIFGGGKMDSIFRKVQELEAK